MIPNYRYFLRYRGQEEKEVTVEEFCKAERAAGFRPKLPSDHPNYWTQPATGGFGSSGLYGDDISGRIEAIPDSDGIRRDLISPRINYSSEGNYGK